MDRRLYGAQMNQHQIIPPEHVAMLQRIAQRLCSERGIDLSSKAAEDLAGSIVSRYQLGLDTEEALFQSFVRGSGE